MRITTKELALIVVFSSLGATLSVPIGYLGNYLKTIPILPFGTGQILSGTHIIILTLTALYIKKPGATTMTAAIKGLVEVILFSYHGIPVILMSALQGLLLDAIIYILGYRDLAFYLGCGIASASNVAFLQFILLLPFPASVFSFMYLLAFFSGTVFGGYCGILLHKTVENRTEHANS
ncbi:ECF transporter S component [Candidatus Bathyarchaeota archaeon]|nr:ECF transporter S component [Candidatus Bathyarchaeota archaeon]